MINKENMSKNVEVILNLFPVFSLHFSNYFVMAVVQRLNFLTTEVVIFAKL